MFRKIYKQDSYLVNIKPLKTWDFKNLKIKTGEPNSKKSRNEIKTH